MIKYVWLNPITGLFSNSWTQEEHDKFLIPHPDIIEHSTLNGGKLIKYECLNDENFAFNINMKLK